MCLGVGAPTPAAMGQRFQTMAAAAEARRNPAPAPPPLLSDPSVTAARAAQRRRQLAAGGYNALTSVPGPRSVPAAPLKTLLGA